MKNLFSVALLAGVGTLFAQVPAKAATYAFSFVGVEDSNFLGGGDLFTSGASSPFVVTGAIGSTTDQHIPGGPFAITGLSSSAVADNLLDFLASAGFWYNSFGAISFATATGGDFSLGGGGADGLQYNALNALFINPDGHLAPQVKCHNNELTILGVPELWPWAMIGLCFVGFTLAAHRRKPSISPFD